MTITRLKRVVRNSAGMLIVGGSCWGVYLAFVHVLRLYFGWHHLAAETAGISLSHLTYYYTNLYVVFKQRPSWPSFAASVVISGGGWIGYMAFQWLVTDKLGVWASLTEIAGIPIKTALNLVFQQWFTFGRLAKQEVRRGLPKVA